MGSKAPNPPPAKPPSYGKAQPSPPPPPKRYPYRPGFAGQSNRAINRGDTTTR